jgi:small subunit ribosomal protein S2
VDVLTMKELLETGVHFGHRTRKWNPKMARYIFTERKGIHIIDLEQTVDLFRKAYYSVRDCVASGGEVVFVGTKKQVQATISEEALRCGAHYVNQRWLGGTLTNFATIKLSIERMKKMEAMIEDGSVEHMPNKEASRMRRRLAKLQRNLDGLRHMDKKPSLMYVIDPDSETIAVHEANLAGIPVIAIVDTNCDPDPIDFLIPGNDDAIKATKLITSRIADAIIEGREGRQDENDSPAATAEAAAAKTEDATAPEGAAAETTEDAPAPEGAAVETTEDAPAPEGAAVETTEDVIVEPATESEEVAEAEVAEVVTEKAEEEVDAAPEVSETVEDVPEVEEADDEPKAVEDVEPVSEDEEELDVAPEVSETVEDVPEVEEADDEPKAVEDVEVVSEDEEEVTGEASEVEEDKEKETDDA